MKKFSINVLLLFIIILANNIKAQTFHGNGGNVPDATLFGGNQACFSIAVSGLNPANIGTSFGLEKVCVNLNSPNAGDLVIRLVAPDGTTVMLSAQNGGTGDNFTNTCFIMSTVNLISTGSAPFNGEYRPDGVIGAVNNGQNGNGTWQICIRDTTYNFSGGGASNLIGWDLTFSTNPAPGIPVCGSNPIAGDLCTTATPITNLSGYCGNTSNSYGPDIPGDLGETDVFCGSIENNSWLSFVADTAIAILDVFVSNCLNEQGIQMRIYETSNCLNFTPVSNCYSTGTVGDFSIIATNLVPGNTYYLMIDGFGGDVCDYMIGASVGVQVPPDTTFITVTTTPAFCGMGGSATVQAEGCSGVYTYNWSTGDTTAAVVNLAPGTYQVTVSDGSLDPMCSANKTFTIADTGSLSLSTTHVDATCGTANGSATVIPNYQNITYTYQWDTNPIQNTAVANHVASGTYNVTVSYGHCSDTSLAIIDNIPSFQLDAKGINTSCGYPNGSVWVEINGGTPPYQIQWMTNPMQITDTINNLYAGTYYVIVSDSVCSGRDTVKINNLGGIDAYFVYDPAITDIFNSQVGFDDVSQGAISWKWSFGNGDTSNIENPHYTYNEIGSFEVQLIVSDSLGCVDTTSRTVIIKDIFTYYIPNAFTPNGDGLNEVFGVKGLGVMDDEFEMVIWNRWGELVFKTNDPEEGWNGQYQNNGTKVQIGIYPYRILAKLKDGRLKEYLGNVTLVN
ncbi:MAG: gliding motility-associated C-terminal domain-containing protein [Bacteroidota bacterium]